MRDGLLIGLVVLAGLACPITMWLGRRGIGPGCRLGTYRPTGEEETVDGLRKQQQALGEEIARLEATASRDTEKVVDRA